jgi:hypothetical protein
MNSKTLRYALGAGVAGLLALGGAGFANAATDDGTDTTVITDDGTTADDSTSRPGGKAGCEDGDGDSGSSTTEEEAPAGSSVTPSSEDSVDSLEL